MSQTQERPRGRERAAAQFRAVHGRAPLVVTSSPGRLELLGNHTDHNQGLVMAVAANRRLFVAASPRKDAQISLASSAFPERETFFIDRIERNPAAPWADYLKGVLKELQRLGAHFTGMDVAVESELPPGGGLASSAALELAFLLAVRELHPFSLREHSLGDAPRKGEDGRVPPPGPKELKRLAELAWRAETRFVGLNCGQLDPLACLMSREGNVTQIDCQSFSIQHDPFPHDCALVVCETGVPHRLVDGAYNRIRANCQAAAAQLRFPSLRPVTMAQLERARGELSEREFACASHVVGENQRVVFAERALREGDHRQFGEYLLQSHESSRDLLCNSTPELDAQVAIAAKLPGWLGGRLTGGGFGGSTLHLVEASKVREFMDAMARRYREELGVAITPWICKPSAGAL